MRAVLATIFFCLMSGAAQTTDGIASFYSTQDGDETASGLRLDDNALTAAHRTLPFGTKVRVTNLKNGKLVVVTITDRGPFVLGRVIDLTPAGAHALNMVDDGVVPVRLEIID